MNKMHYNLQVWVDDQQTYEDPDFNPNDRSWTEDELNNVINPRILKFSWTTQLKEHVINKERLVYGQRKPILLILRV